MQKRSRSQGESRSKGARGMIYLFVIVLLLIAYIVYLQYSFAKERKRYVELIAAKDFPEFKMFEKEEQRERKKKKNLFTARDNRENPKVGD